MKRPCRWLISHWSRIPGQHHRQSWTSHKAFAICWRHLSWNISDLLSDRWSATTTRPKKGDALPWISNLFTIRLMNTIWGTQYIFRSLCDSPLRARKSGCGSHCSGTRNTEATLRLRPVNYAACQPTCVGNLGSIWWSFHKPICIAPALNMTVYRQSLGPSNPKRRCICGCCGLCRGKLYSMCG